ncbi:hypothetical protein GBAR_LOCUS27664 [Geodia barretti]|uniref:Uncharacterized protein n=1 Tax=Geodia barretti TaxID=519541 RepID=A0AA35TLJ3_GEOBA|nr:hypothetical protein GBAR_LOCUS27664 [Geodia barretti]
MWSCQCHLEEQSRHRTSEHNHQLAWGPQQWSQAL